ncbi:MAG: hypothetical protein L0H64_14165, partial [Pseudonocardia sp.]|nr:hypothetical protein [Pseudonocardia sp.]
MTQSMQTLTVPTPRLLLPGMAPREPGLETYWVKPGAVTAIRVGGGDRVDVVDRQGRQPAEVTVVGERGYDGAALDLSIDAPATVLRGLGQAGGSAPGAAAVLAMLAERGADPTAAVAARLFGQWSPAGARERFTADRDAVVVVAAPAEPMSVADEAANPPTDLLLEVRRSARRSAAEPRLPEPLAEPILDMRIDAATARGYEVKAGQYIQIIDVEG